MNETSLWNAVIASIIFILLCSFAILGIGCLTIDDSFILGTMAAGILAVFIACMFIYQTKILSLRLKTAIILLIPVVAIEVFAVYFGSAGSLTLSFLVILIICAISRDTTLLLGMAMLANAVFAYNIMFTEIRRFSPTAIAYNVFLFQVGAVVLYLLARWSNAQMEAFHKKAREAELAARAKSEFLANMSHEIRTPMNAVFGFTTFLQRQELSKESQENVVGIRTASQTLLSLINDILDLSKIDSGKHEIIPTTYELASLVNDTISTICVRVENKPIRFFVEIDPQLPGYLIGDDVRIRQIMINFLANAIKFTKSGFVKLRIWGVRSNKRLLLYVSTQDTGDGIHEEDKNKLFRSFQQFDTHKNRMIEGTGLGLTLSRKLIESMNGSVCVESVYGEGSTFTFMLPQELPENVEPFVNLEIDPDIRVIVCESNREEMESWEKSLKSLHVDHLLVSSFSEFKFLLDSGPNTRFFLDSRMFKRFGSSLVPLKESITIVVDRNESFHSPSPIPMLRRPIYSLPVAAALAGREMVRHAHVLEETYEHFTAPQARILVVDDNSVNLTIFSGLLAPYQCDIRLASSGGEAVELLKDDYFDLVFMDHMMPELDGVETAKIVRELSGRSLRHFDASPHEFIDVDESYYKNIPIVVATANAIVGMREEYLAGDFDDYIAKPINPVKLHGILQQWIPSEKQRRRADQIQETEMRNDHATGMENISKMQLRYLNPAAGLKFIGGDGAGYFQVLELFRRHASESLRAIRVFFNEERWKELTIEVHSTKSISKGIGAERLSVMAAAMEAAGKREDRNFLRNHFEEYLNLYQSVLGDIDTVMRFQAASGQERQQPESLPPIPMEMPAFQALLNEIASALESYDYSESLRLIEQIPFDSVDPASAESLKIVRALVEQFDYEPALQRILETIRQIQTVR